MIAEYQKHVEANSNKLTARIAASDVKGLVTRAKNIERIIRAKEPEFTMRWRDVTTGLILGYFEHQGIKYDNTYKYLNRMSSNIIDFFEFLRENYNYDKPNPAIEAQRILLDETTWIKNQAAESYKILNANLKKVGEVTAASIGRKPALTDEPTERKTKANAKRRASSKQTKQAA